MSARPLGMSRVRWLVALAVWGLGALVGGCSGGGGGGGPDGAGAPPSGATGGGTLTGPALDVELRGQFIQANMTRPSVPAVSPQQFALGQALMFDKVLSGNRDVSCATCHNPSLATSDALSLPIGVGGSGLGPGRLQGVGQQGQGLLPFVGRHAPDLFGRGSPLWTTLFWDGRVALREGRIVSPAGAQLPAGLSGALAAQAMFPVVARVEMRGQAGDLDAFGSLNELALRDDSDFAGVWSDLMARLLALPGYQQLFAQAFPEVPQGQLGFQHAANALAAFQTQAFASFNSPYDRYLSGDNDALTEAEKRGGLVFTGPGRCWQCHNGPLLTNQRFHNVGVPQLGPGVGLAAPQDLGIGQSADSDEVYRFRTPPLRNVALTAPYFHDGAFSTLEAVVAHYQDPRASLRGYNPASHLEPRLQGAVLSDPAVVEDIAARLDPRLDRPLRLSPEQVADLLAFLRALTDPASRDLSATVPATVPSGLPVAP